MLQFHIWTLLNIGAHPSVFLCYTLCLHTHYTYVHISIQLLFLKDMIWLEVKLQWSQPRISRGDIFSLCIWTNLSREGIFISDLNLPKSLVHFWKSSPSVGSLSICSVLQRTGLYPSNSIQAQLQALSVKTLVLGSGNWKLDNAHGVPCNPGEIKGEIHCQYHTSNICSNFMPSHSPLNKQKNTIHNADWRRRLGFICINTFNLLFQLTMSLSNA